MIPTPMPTKKTPPKSYTITEAAKKLGISRQAVHAAIKRGLIEAERGEIVQTVWLIPAKSLKSYRVSDVHQSVGKKNN